jgi:hypothetical protein
MISVIKEVSDERESVMFSKGGDAMVRSRKGR